MSESGNTRPLTRWARGGFYVSVAGLMVAALAGRGGRVAVVAFAAVGLACAATMIGGVWLTARARLRDSRRRLMAVARICPACGYNLRATPERCPECGHAVDAPVGASDIPGR